jgi:SAM-dependent methyltransferase
MTYRSGAERFYDLFGAKDDVDFYRQLAHEHGDRALELGVGTARLAIELAGDGVEVWGIDNSEHMLRAAKRKIAAEPPAVRSRITLRRADVRSFDLQETFSYIYFPSYTFDHLLTRGDQLSALRCIRRHLRPGGVYAFDLAHVKEHTPSSGWFIQRKDLGEGRMVVRSGFHRTNPVARTSSMDLFYEVYVDGKMMERYHEYGEVYVHTPEGIRRLLEETGFEIVAFYGDHIRTPFIEESEKMVIVTEKRRDNRDIPK